MPLQVDKATADAIKRLGVLSSVGLAFVVAVVLGFAAGYLLDSWLGTSPWLSMAFFFIGVVAGMLNVFRMVKSSGL